MHRSLISLCANISTDILLRFFTVRSFLKSNVCLASPSDRFEKKQVQFVFFLLTGEKDNIFSFNRSCYFHFFFFFHAVELKIIIRTPHLYTIYLKYHFFGTVKLSKYSDSLRSVYNHQSWDEEFLNPRKKYYSPISLAYPNIYKMQNANNALHIFLVSQDWDIEKLE